MAIRLRVDTLIATILVYVWLFKNNVDADDDDITAGIYKNYTEGLMSDSLCDEVDLSQFCQHVRLLFLILAYCNICSCTDSDGGSSSSSSSSSSSHDGNIENVYRVFEKLFGGHTIRNYMYICIFIYVYVYVYT